MLDQPSDETNRGPSESQRDDGLSEAEADPNPLTQFDRWFREALEAELPAPNAMTLATATAEGRPSARMVLLKGYDDEGFVFYTNYESRKGRELAENPYAALVLHWEPLRRQVRVTGRVVRVSREESEHYFHTRPPGSQLGAWASQQSTVIASREALEEEMRRLRERHEGEVVPLPPFWGGFRVIPDAIEFWHGRANRLHDRLLYTRQPDGAWRIERLSP